AFGRMALARRSDSRKWAAGARLLQLGCGRGDLPPIRAQRAYPSRLADQGGDRLSDAVHTGSRSPRPGSVAGAARRSPQARGHIRALRFAGPAPGLAVDGAPVPRITS